MKRFEAVPAYKSLLFYSFALILLSITYVVGIEDLSPLWLLPVALLLAFVLYRVQVSASFSAGEALAKLEKALQTTQIGVTITDLKGKIIYLNAAEARMHGYEPEELIGKDARLFASPQIWEVNPVDLIREMSSWRRESENLRKDGSSFPVHLVSDIIRNHSGEPIGMVTICEDVTERRKAETKLRESELKFRSVAESATDAIVQADCDGTIIFWNSSAQRIFGYTAHEALGRPLTLLMPHRYQELHRKAVKNLISGGQPHIIGRILELHGLRKTGEEFPLELSLSSWMVATGTVFSGIMRDITDRKLVEQELHRHEEHLEDLVRRRTSELAEINRRLELEIKERKEIEIELRASEERYELAVRGGKEGLWDWNLVTNEIFYAAPWKSMLGYDEHEITNRPEEWLNRVHADDLTRLNQEFTSHLKGLSDHFASEHRMLHKDGTYRWVLSRGAAIRDSSGTAIRVAGIQRDINDRKMMEADWKERAFLDALTSLPNRVLFIERLEQALHRLQRQRDGNLGILYIDLDFFKQINDTYGHQVGDQLLVAVARKLKSFVRPGDTIARIGGDEFTILLEDLKSPDEATRIAERICAELREPFYLEDQIIQTSASVGIAINRGIGDVATSLLNNADLAMYLAKGQGRARYQLFDSEG